MDGQDETDYSDFKYQHVQQSLQFTPNDDQASAGGSVQIEPLNQAGGLDQNEVAELVQMETIAYVELEDESADQNVATTGSMRAVIGANLPNSREAFPEGGGTTTDGTTYDVTNADFDNVLINSLVDDRIFQQVQTQFGVPFDDAASGVGGSGSHENFHNTKNFRQEVGRGPVLDSTDDITINSDLNVSDALISVGGEIRVSFVWDTAEVSDAGRAFSLP